jgi:hypothetical protein
MKNDSVSFKLVALVIIAGVIAAFLDTSTTKKAAPTVAATPVATVAAATETASQ